jgi:hypothetical protein
VEMAVYIVIPLSAGYGRLQRDGLLIVASCFECISQRARFRFEPVSSS